MNFIKRMLNLIEESGLYPDNKSLCGPQEPVVNIKGSDLTMFCSNNYLNLSNHPGVIEAAGIALKQFGTGSGGSRHMSGTNSAHLQLEKDIAFLKGSNDALIFSSGYLANIAAVSAVANPLAGISILGRSAIKEFQKDTCIFSDELNHASIIDACKIAGKKCILYQHTNMSDLSKKLTLYNGYHKIIVSDGVFSMDGDIAPLPQIVELSKKHKAFIILDDAHATGILGANGRGTAEYFNLENEIDLQVGTLNKVFGAIGGFVSGDNDICKLLRVTSRPYIFSASIPAAVAAAISASIKILSADPTIRDRLLKNINLFNEIAGKTGLQFRTNQITPIIPLIIGDEKKAIAISRQLYELGFFIQPVTWPAVPKGKARLRITLMSQHTHKQIVSLINTLEGLCLKMNSYEESRA